MTTMNTAYNTIAAKRAAAELPPGVLDKVVGGMFHGMLEPLLEKLLDCRQGKHEWEITGEEGLLQEDRSYLFRKVYTCKVCREIYYGSWDIRYE